jgi:hypothetical protein
MTNGQSSSLSWRQAPTWGPGPDFYYCQTVVDSLIWGTVSDERTSLSFTIAAGPHQCSRSRVQVPQDSWPCFTLSDLRFPQHGGPGLCIYIPQEQGGPVIPQALGSIFVASYDLQSYGGGIRTRLHTGATYDSPAGPCSIVSAWTTQKTLLPTVPLLQSLNSFLRKRLYHTIA